MVSFLRDWIPRRFEFFSCYFCLDIIPYIFYWIQLRSLRKPTQYSNFFLLEPMPYYLWGMFRNGFKYKWLHFISKYILIQIPDQFTTYANNWADAIPSNRGSDHGTSITVPNAIFGIPKVRRLILWMTYNCFSILTYPIYLGSVDPKHILPKLYWFVSAGLCKCQPSIDAAFWHEWFSPANSFRRLSFVESHSYQLSIHIHIIFFINLDNNFSDWLLRPMI